MIKIILVEDHVVVRSGIKLLLDSQTDMCVIAEAENGKEALSILDSGILPDIILTDITMAEMGGIELLNRLNRDYNDIKTIVLSMLGSSQYALDVFEKGTNGYLVKNVGHEELLFCIRHVANGGRYVCEEVSMLLMEEFRNISLQLQTSRSSAERFELTDREIEVLELIGEGYTNTEIGDKLFLSKRTIEGHRQSLLEKTKCNNTASLIKVALKCGLIS